MPGRTKDTKCVGGVGGGGYAESRNKWYRGAQLLRYAHTLVPGDVCDGALPPGSGSTWKACVCLTHVQGSALVYLNVFLVSWLCIREHKLFLVMRKHRTERTSVLGLRCSLTEREREREREGERGREGERERGRERLRVVRVTANPSSLSSQFVWICKCSTKLQHTRTDLKGLILVLFIFYTHIFP